MLHACAMKCEFVKCDCVFFGYFYDGFRNANKSEGKTSKAPKQA